MGAVLLIGALTGFLGFGICLLGAAATFQQRGVAEWRTELVWGLLSICFLAVAVVSTCYAEKIEIGLRQQPARHACCCECRECGCGTAKESNKENDNGKTEDQR